MDKRKGLTTAVAVLVILSFVWIIAICALLWGRQLSDFSSLELTFFIILAASSILLWALFSLDTFIFVTSFFC